MMDMMSSDEEDAGAEDESTHNKKEEEAGAYLVVEDDGTGQNTQTVLKLKSCGPNRVGRDDTAGKS